MASFLFIVVVIFSSAFSSSCSSSYSLVSRESFPMEGDVAWVVQVSDLHISAYHPERADDMARLLGPALATIRPDLFLITGDITDAKNRRRTSTRQDESEWIQYKNSLDSIVRRCGLDKRRVFDIRGNHDKYGVPHVGSSLDFFSSYSINSQLNRLSNIYSISLMAHFETSSHWICPNTSVSKCKAIVWKEERIKDKRTWTHRYSICCKDGSLQGSDRTYMFLGIDDTMNIGIRGPSNLFGHPTDDLIRAMEAELRYWDNGHLNSSITKVVFGHFPMSFTAASEKGERYEAIFARQSVAAYICGHLHAKFGKRLWRRHNVEVTSPSSRVPNTVERHFWEWELGDWKEYKMIRILAIDGGEVSFVDMELPNRVDNFPTTILITYPTDSRSMNRLDAASRSQLLRNDLNAVIFSTLPIVNVTAKVFDSSRAFKIVEEIPLQLAATDSAVGNKPLYHAKWNAENYRDDSSAARYWVQVFVLDSQGKSTLSAPRPFSVEGKQATEYPVTWLAHLVFGVRWEALYFILLWGNLCFLFMLLLLPKLLNQFMDRSSSYQRWAASVSISSPIQQRRVLFTVLWFLIEGSRHKALWSSMAVYLFCLLKLPWFWGHVTSENGDIAPMYLFGWRVNSPHTKSSIGLGNPDVLPITLPFMYFVVAPLWLLIYGLYAERSAACFQASGKNAVQPERPSLFVVQSLSKPPEANITSFLHPGRRRRKVLLLACIVLACIHFKQCCSVMRAYGGGSVALSPVFSWVPPLLLASAIYSSSRP